MTIMTNWRGVYHHPESDTLYVDVRSNAPHLYCDEVDPSDLTAGTKIQVATGYAEVLADMDFETYSEAGYNFDPVLNKWISVANTAPHGLGAVGAAVYSEHPSTEVLSLSYNLKDGIGPRLWIPGMPPPYDLFNHILQGGLIEAANSGFEYFIWLNVCHKRMGWPALSHLQLRDTLAKARAHSLPGALGKIAKVLEVKDQKIDEGKRLLDKFSKPRNPTKNDARTRIRPTDPDALVEGNALYTYNLGDIKAESAVSACIPDLSDYELKLWLLDQKINFRGVHIDKEAVDACLEIVRQATEKYTAELIALTGGYVQTAGEIKKITEWVGGRGVHVPGMTADDVETLLSRPNLPGDVKRVLEIRASLGAASVKKLYSISRRLCSDNRIRDILSYCGADRTGRWAGRGPQPQNLPNSGPSVRRCDRINGCGHYSGHDPYAACPWCSAPDWALSPEDWSIDAVEDAITVIKYRRLDLVERVFGDAIAAVSGCLRGMFTAAPGKDFICSDYSAIEAVVLAALAGEEWRLEVFRTHGKIYEMSASKITGIPFEEFAKHKKETGQHHPMRKKVGKVAELACFAPDTLVLTSVGYVRIMDVTRDHFLWDGTQWTKSDGAIYKGRREVIQLDGVLVTPNHPIRSGNSWRPASELASNKNTLTRALELGSENLPSLTPTWLKIFGAPSSYALADAARTLCLTPIFTWGSPRGAGPADVKKAQKLLSKNIVNTLTSSLIRNIVDASSIDLGRLSRDARHQITSNLLITGDGAYGSALNGLERMVRGRFSSTLSPCPDGITLDSKWIGLTVMGTTPPATSDSSQNGKTPLISDQSKKCKNASTNLSDVYDIVNAGPRSRFTILTESGHLIVHNSGYQGGLGAWKNFGADEFMSDDEIKANIKKWRDESPMIVKFWYGLEEAAVAAIQNPGQCFEFRGLKFGCKDDVLYIQLLSGRKLSYHQPRLHPDVTPWGKTVLKITYMGMDSVTKQWVRLDTYGGKLCENVVQATARDILAHALLLADEAGYDPVLHIHDEMVSEVDEGWGTVEEFERIMATLPHWCKDWPIKAAGGWRGKRYRKD